MTEEEKYLVAFSTVIGIGSARLSLLLKYFGSAEKAWKATEEDLKQTHLPKDALIELLNQRKILKLDQYIENLEKSGIKFLTIHSPDYPKRLRIIPDPPNILYIRSKLAGEQVSRIVENKTIGVVGTRKITQYGKEVTKELTAGLVSAGFTIVSGMALGVDGVAHGTTLNCGGVTIAVLGVGVDVIYPKEHTELYYQIIESGGAIVSEVAPEKHVIRGVFPARNRIISGLSQAVLVTEGAIDSGSLITARAALDQGREVFAVPGPINSPMAQGTNYLLKQGAKLVTGVEDILQELGYTDADKRGQTLADISKQIPTGGTREEQAVIDLLVNEPMEFDDLIKKSGLEAARLGAVLTNLELGGKIHACGLRYSLQ
ncbi:DNA-processing protein DprA [Patescibacteria group bacterium]|nr:DNA-processing protein DprA [Patescibacteria group bacterium]